MTILDALKFVRGAVSRKDLVPALQHFCIRNGHIRSFNGTLGLSSPIPSDLDVAPAGLPFAKAIEACGDETVSMWMEDNNRLSVVAGKFRVLVDCVPSADFPDITPHGKRVMLDSSLLPALKYLEPSIAEDASRPWACGILFDGDFAYATNNIILQQYWLGYSFPERVNIPAAAVRELLRIGTDPVHMLMEEKTVSFHYADGRWLRTQLFEAAWPDVNPLLDSLAEANLRPFPAEFFTALERLVPFTNELGQVFFRDGSISTSPEPDAAGATIWLGDELLPPTGCFNVNQLLKLKPIANEIDFGAYPKACPFMGELARGVITGYRQ